MDKKEELKCDFCGAEISPVTAVTWGKYHKFCSTAHKRMYIEDMEDKLERR